MLLLLTLFASGLLKAVWSGWPSFSSSQANHSSSRVDVFLKFDWFVVRKISPGFTQKYRKRAWEKEDKVKYLENGWK